MRECFLDGIVSAGVPSPLLRIVVDGTLSQDFPRIDHCQRTGVRQESRRQATSNSAFSNAVNELQLQWPMQAARFRFSQHRKLVW